MQQLRTGGGPTGCEISLPFLYNCRASETVWHVQHHRTNYRLDQYLNWSHLMLHSLSHSLKCPLAFSAFSNTASTAPSATSAPLKVVPLLQADSISHLPAAGAHWYYLRAAVHSTQRTWGIVLVLVSNPSLGHPHPHPTASKALTAFPGLQKASPVGVLIVQFHTPNLLEVSIWLALCSDGIRTLPPHPKSPFPYIPPLFTVLSLRTAHWWKAMSSPKTSFHSHMLKHLEISRSAFSSQLKYCFFQKPLLTSPSDLRELSSGPPGAFYTLVLQIMFAHPFPHEKGLNADMSTCFPSALSTVPSTQASI